MRHKSGSNESCPVGHNKCAVLDEVRELRGQCEHLMQLSITDPLTGLFNYRHLVTTLDHEMERTRRTGLPMGFVMLDLDHFKRVNDMYGHQAGDLALQWVSRILKKNTRRIDIPCRYGGEEFAVILPGTDIERAAHLAERLRKVLTKSPLVFGPHSILLTASFGVVAYKGRNNPSVERVFDCADHMLFRAKMLGRNRVCSDSFTTPQPCTEVTSDERGVLYGSSASKEAAPDSKDGLQEE